MTSEYPHVVLGLCYICGIGTEKNKKVGLRILVEGVKLKVEFAKLILDRVQSSSCYINDQVFAGLKLNEIGLRKWFETSLKGLNQN